MARIEQNQIPNYPAQPQVNQSPYQPVNPAQNVYQQTPPTNISQGPLQTETPIQNPLNPQQ